MEYGQNPTTPTIQASATNISKGSIRKYIVNVCV